MNDTTALRDLLGKVKAGVLLDGVRLLSSCFGRTNGHLAFLALKGSIDAANALCRIGLPGWTMTLTINDEINEDGVVLFRGTSPLFRCKGPLGRAALICIIEAMIWEAEQ